MGGLKPRGAKAKGDRYERELAQHFNEKLFNGEDKIFRAPLSGGGRNIGGGGQADLTGTPKVWVEAKRTERFQPYQAMEQAEKGIQASRCPDFPVVINRKSQVKTEDSLVCMRLSDWLSMYGVYLKSIGVRIEDDTYPSEM
jgi:Holliday junction resolvase